MNTIKVGFADEIITPELIGTFMDGYGFRMKPADSIRDDLHAKVCAFVSGEEIHLLFSLDIIGLMPEIYRLVTAQITALTGVPVEHISINCIHTHSAPANGSIAELPVNYDYFGYVGDCCGLAAKRAIERACPGSFEFAILPQELDHIYNRRGQEYVDRRIRAAAFRDEHGVLRGVLASASCHAVINRSMAISADFLAELNAVSSDEVPYLYLQGRCGDIDPRRDEHSEEELIGILGRELTAPVQAYVQSTKGGKLLEGNIGCIYEQVQIPMTAMDDQEEVTACIRECEKEYFALEKGSAKHYKFREMQWLRKMLYMAQHGESFDLNLPMQLLWVGKEFVFVFVPFEVLTLTGFKLEEMFVKRGFPKEAVYVLGYSNSVQGYLAPSEEFQDGGYEIRGAAQWYGIAPACKDTEKTVLDWFAKQAQKL